MSVAPAAVLTVIALLGAWASPPNGASLDPPTRAEVSVRAGERPAIAPAIEWRRSIKQDVADRIADPQERELALAEAGVASGDLQAARCAVYVDRELTPEEIDLLRDIGCEIQPSLYVPPVPGRHPHGFYLARIAYGSMAAVAAEPAIRRLESVEGVRQPQLDVAAQIIRADLVREGAGVAARSGVGVKLAIADSGMDLSHPDLPTPVEAFDMTDGDSLATWGLDVANTVTDHGTHVVGIATGDGGRSGGRYVGTAPDADLLFYKVGNDVNAIAGEADTIEALCRAIDVGADVLSLSIGGFSLFMDGSEPIEQAVDAATQAGVAVFVAAGNEGAKGRHDAAFAPPGGASQEIEFFIDNTFPFGFRTRESFRIIWRDGAPGDANIVLETVNIPAGASPSLIEELVDVSSRGTEVRQFALSVTVPPGGATYRLRLRNDAASGESPLAHVYAMNGTARFVDSDGSFTVLSPALADTAIAVGAWVHRNQWTSASGEFVDFSSQWPIDALAPYSSRGPRIDGLLKPDIVAPGCYTIAARDSTPGLADMPQNVIDNDGLNLDGSGPAEYFARAGTSMATPLAAGVAVLALEANPTLSPEELRTTLSSTASLAGASTPEMGFGVIDAFDAVKLAERIGAPGDVTRDGRVNANDLLLMLSSWGPCPADGSPCPADIDGDGRVGPSDLLLLLANFSV